MRTPRSCTAGATSRILSTIASCTEAAKSRLSSILLLRVMALTRFCRSFMVAAEIAFSRAATASAWGSWAKLRK